MDKSTIKSSMVSVLVHLGLVLALVFYIDFAPKETIQLGDPDTRVIASYIDPDRPQATVLRATQAPPITSIIKKTTTLALKKPPPLATPLPQPTPMSAQSQGRSVNELLELLHNAIQEHQIYPANALMMEREGRVTLGFILQIDGTIQALHVVTSSGNDSLDAAALAAVEGAAPFQHIDQYLHAPQDYKLDVVFKLT